MNQTDNLIPVTIEGKQRWLDADLCKRQRYGFIALHNDDGTLEEMQVIVNQCYPDDITKVNSDIVYLFTDKADDRCWTSSYSTSLVSFPISAFFADPPLLPVSETGKRALTLGEEQIILQAIESRPFNYGTVREHTACDDGLDYGYRTALSSLPASIEQLLSEREQMRKAILNFLSVRNADKASAEWQQEIDNLIQVSTAHYQ